MMELKRLALPEPFLTPRRKLVSFSIIVAAYLAIFTLLLHNNNSVSVSKLKVFPNPFCSSRPSSFSASSSSSAVNKTREVNVSGIQDTIPFRDFTENVKNASLHVAEQSFRKQTHVENHTLVAEKASFLDSNGVGNSSEITNSESLSGDKDRNTANTTHKTMVVESLRNSIFSTEIHNVANFSQETHEGESIEKSNMSSVHHDNSKPKKTKISLYEACDIFDGKWVRDDSKPYYPMGSCPHIDRDFNCHLNGRLDGEFVKWKWQPNGCDIPSLNATDFLERLRGQRLVFVGDSLNRNMWESMVCIFRQSMRDKKRVYEISGRTEFKKKGIYAFRFEDYNCSVDFIMSPFIVRESSFKGKNGTFETLRLDLMDKTTSMYHDANIIVFNTGHWWTHEKTSRGEEYYQEGNHVHPKLEVLDAYRRALTTWARWVDRNIKANRTQVFFRGYSVTHFSGGQWNSGGQCDKETQPIFNKAYLQAYPSKMRVVEQVIQKMRTPVMYMNISRLTDYRKDGHPSIYRKEYKSQAERNSTEIYQDCSHWCLPGVPDAWNELLYASLLQHGKGAWKS